MIDHRPPHRDTSLFAAVDSHSQTRSPAETQTQTQGYRETERHKALQLLSTIFSLLFPVICLAIASLSSVCPSGASFLLLLAIWMSAGRLSVDLSAASIATVPLSSPAFTNQAEKGDHLARFSCFLLPLISLRASALL